MNLFSLQYFFNRIGWHFLHIVYCKVARYKDDKRWSFIWGETCECSVICFCFFFLPPDTCETYYSSAFEKGPCYVYILPMGREGQFFYVKSYMQWWKTGILWNVSNFYCWCWTSLQYYACETWFIFFKNFFKQFRLFRGLSLLAQLGHLQPWSFTFKACSAECFKEQSSTKCLPKSSFSPKTSVMCYEQGMILILLSDFMMKICGVWYSRLQLRISPRKRK